MSDPSSASPAVSRYLARAAWQGSVRGIHYFLQKRFRIEEVVAGRTPVLWAVSGGHVAAVNLLVQRGADISKKTTDGDTALICAVWSGNAKMVQSLMNKGFDLNAKGSQGKTALDWAEESGRADLVKILREPTLAASHARAVARQEHLRGRVTCKPKIRLAP